MSEYPRPGKPSRPPSLFPPDGFAALVYIGILVLSTAWWVAENFRAWGARGAEEFQRSLWYFEAYAGILLLYIAALWWMARGRMGGFVVVLLIAGWSGILGVVRQNHLTAGLCLLLAAYALLRLSGRFGPRPIRRRDLRSG